MNKRTLVLLRHGAVRAQNGLCYGHLDLELSDTGIRQASAISGLWKDQPRRIISSDLTRTRQTAELIFPETTTTMHHDTRLRELDMGDWEGRSWDDLHNEQPGVLKQWAENWVDRAPPGGETGRQLYSRVAECYTEIIQNAEPGTVIVAHAGSLRALACLLNKQGPEALFSYQIEHCAPFSLY